MANQANAASIDPEELRAMDRAIGDLALLSGRSINSIMRQMIPRIARSAARATKPGTKFPPNPKNRKSRKITSTPHGRARKSKGIPWWADYQIDVWKQDRGGHGTLRKLYVTESKRNKYIRIPNRGVAKAAWFGAIPRMLSGGTGVVGISAGNRYSNGRVKRERGNIIGATMENRVRYITRAGGNSARVGIQKQTNWLGNAIKREEARIERRFASTVRRAVGGIV